MEQARSESSTVRAKSGRRYDKHKHKHQVCKTIVSSVASYSFSVFLLDGRRGMACEISRTVRGRKLHPIYQKIRRTSSQTSAGIRARSRSIPLPSAGGARVPDFWPSGAAGGARVRDFWPSGAAGGAKVRDFRPSERPAALGYETFGPESFSRTPPGVETFRPEAPSRAPPKSLVPWC